MTRPTKQAIPSQDCPVVDFDPFSNEMLTNPFPAYEELRKLGSVVKLANHDCYAVLDYEPLMELLLDWKTFSSNAGIGIDNYNKQKPWRPKSIILELDPPDHDKTRRVLNRVLCRPAMEKMRQTFSLEAKKLVARLVEKKEFDGVKDLGDVYPLKVFPDAVGVNKQGRENLFAYGTMVFNSIYPHNRLFEESMQNVAEVQAWIISQCERKALTGDGLGAHVYQAVERGEVSEMEAGHLVRALLSAGVDTTMSGIGNALYCFARFPEQWQKLKERPDLIRSAIDEVLRFEGGVMNFFRTTTKDVDLGGVRISANEKVLILFSAGDRDPKKWSNPDTFDIDRNISGHLGFGGGVHTCVGQMVARLEVELVLFELVQLVDEIELNGEPVRRLNNSLRGLASLPLKVR